MSKFLSSWVIVFSLAAVAGAEDWPQWRGGERDGQVRGFTAPASWPEKLEQVWRREVGAGYASPVMGDGKLYVHTREGDEEVVSCLALADGKPLWSARYPAPYEKNSYAVKHGKGPNSTPALAGGRLYTLGISAVLSSFDAASGKLLWRQDGSRRVSTEKLFCGTSASPVVASGLVIAYLGDDHAGALTAFDAESGEERWAWKGAGPGYASPIVAEIAGTRQVVTLTERSAIGVDLESGRLLWQVEFTDQWNENIVTPLVHGDVVVVAGVRQGTLARRVRHRDGKWSTEEVWTRADLPQYMSSPVADGGVLYGFSSRQKGQVFALDLESGKTLWTSEGRLGENAVVYAAGAEHLVLLTTGAELIVGRRAPSAWAEVARYEVAQSPTWASPVLYQGHVVVKDASGVALWRLD